MTTKSRIAIELSKIKGYVNPKIKLEQYVTDSEFAAEILWNAYLDGNIENKSIADLGSGTGIFSLGCLILNAKKVYAVDNDMDALNLAKENIKDARCEFIHSDVNEFNKKVGTVIENPPYGTRNKHIDREFLIKAFEIAEKVYSMHKLSTSKFVEKVARNNGFKVSKVFKVKLPLKKSYDFHRKNVEKIEVGCWFFEKQ